MSFNLEDETKAPETPDHDRTKHPLLKTSMRRSKPDYGMVRRKSVQFMTDHPIDESQRSTTPLSRCKSHS